MAGYRRHRGKQNLNQVERAQLERPLTTNLKSIFDHLFTYYRGSFQFFS